MDIIGSLTREVYALSFTELIVYAVIFTWLYMKIREYILAKSRKVWQALNIILLALFTAFVLYMVVFTREMGSSKGEIELIPFYSYYQFFKGNNSEAFFTNKANMLLFFPFGLLLFDRIKTRKNVIIYLVTAFVFSLSIEVIQYVFSLGFAQADDVIHNTLGAFLGYVASIYIPRIQISIKK